MKKQIKFSSLQRFDLNDANDLQGLVDDQLTLQNYGLKGGNTESTLNGGMILSPFACTSVGAGSSSGTAFFTLQQFTFMLPNGEVVEHNEPATTISYSTLRSAAISAGAAKIGYLWGNYNLENIEQENREFWSSIDEATYNQNVYTRTQKSPTFIVTTTSGQPAAIEGRLWTRLAYVITNSSGVVVATSSVTQYNEMAGMQYYKPLEVTSSTTSRRFGLGTYWNNIEEMFYKIITSGSADDSGKTTLARGANPQYSLQGLKREIDKKATIGVIATAKIILQVSDGGSYTAFSNYYADQGFGVSNNIVTNKGYRDQCYQHFFDPTESDADKLGKDLFFYEWDNVLWETVRCNFGSATTGADLPILWEDPDFPTQTGSKSLCRLEIQTGGANPVSSDVLTSIYNTNKVDITVSPTYRVNSVAGDLDISRGPNGLAGMVYPVKRMSTSTTTDALKKDFYPKLFTVPQAGVLYLDLNIGLLSPWLFPYMNEVLFRDYSDANAVVSSSLPDYITIHVDIYGDVGLLV